MYNMMNQGFSSKSLTDLNYFRVGPRAKSGLLVHYQVDPIESALPGRREEIIPQRH